ncbi:hypothetical protein ALQ60_200247 [Pseudomonas syringae pv. papulans]|uniref:hypothetical protein n=1 Tax=Pseudomonas syringae TaxID=317 RepID=UPI000EFF1551|nr:hypothetical protein [Pseudomonas syringae]RMN40078.1 hypothetical protein ALQ60_200247 [Pseudomonas syringae pv. papulans]RMN69073.1 hypothetical protein ALQ56_200524 [Pseudomonas syringae pv. papulans]
MNDIDKLDAFRSRSSKVHDNRNALTAHARFDLIGEELDSTLNFKVNSGLKSEFEKLCKNNESNVSREIKLYMRAAVISGKLL